MAKSLTDLVRNVKGVGRDFGRNLRKYAAIGAVGLGSYLGTPSQVYADKYVNNTMNYTDINATIASATSGEAVHFEAGDYEFPLEPVGANILVTSGARLVADGVVTLRGVDPTVGVIVRLNSINSGLSGFIIENAKKGISVNADFNPSTPIYVTGNTIQNVETGMSWTNKSAIGNNSLPSVIVDSNYIRAVFAGNIFDKQSEIVDGTKAWAQVSNNTFEDISGVVYSPPFYSTTTTAGTSHIVLGLNQFDGNVNINSNGVTLPDSVMGGVGGPLTSATTASTQVEIPDANGEHHIALNPDPAYPFVDYISNVWGGNNVASTDSASAKISWSRRLLLGSPHWADGRCKNSNGFERHYCGAFPPMGDWNADGRLNDYDEENLETKKTGEGICSTDNLARQIYDFDNDCDIDNTDHVAFLNNGFQGIPNIQTLSQWGLFNMGLAILIAGTLVLRRKNRCITPSYNATTNSN